MANNFPKMQSLDPRVKRGVSLFNEMKFFEAHEELELAWRAETEDIRNFYRGILQIGVAFYHIQNQNFNGAIKLFQRAQKWLAPYSGIVLGIHISKLKSDALKIQKTIEARINSNNRFSGDIVFPLIKTDF